MNPRVVLIQLDLNQSTFDENPSHLNPLYKSNLIGSDKLIPF